MVKARGATEISLGAVRLAIVGDCKLGLQPLEDRWGGHLVFNGEVFEPKEILHSLGETFHPEDSDGVALEAVLAIKGPSGLGAACAACLRALATTPPTAASPSCGTRGVRNLFIWRVGERGGPFPLPSVPSARGRRSQNPGESSPRVSHL
jgi:hypothetical protein